MATRLRPGRGWQADVAAALPAWLTARLVVLGALAVARFLANHLHPATAGVVARAHEGLFGWDASWYADIAAKGYARLPREALRFFPLVPLSARRLGVVLAGHERWALLVIANGSALAFAALLHRLAWRETGDAALARRAAWLAALAPPAFVFVMGYSDATAAALAVLAFLALRDQRWGWAAVAGLLAGLARPVGALLVVPAAVEAWRARAGRGHQQLVSRLAAVVAPLVGVGIFLVWVGTQFGDAWLPMRIQEQRNLRGHLANPLHTLSNAAHGLSSGDRVGTGLHLPWVAVLLVLLVVVVRRWPAAYALFAAVALAVLLTASNLDSMERYALGSFPFVLAGAALLASERVERVAFVVSSVLLFAYALLAFLNLSVP